MRLSRAALAYLCLCFLLISPKLALCQDEEDGSGSDGEESDDGGLGPTTNIGANPPDALVGCVSPYTYVEGESRLGLSTYHALIEADPTSKAAMKYRNFTGTILVPTDMAFSNLASKQNINVEQPGVLDTASLQSYLQYSVLFTAIDPTTLAAQSGTQNYSTALALTSTDGNANLNPPAYELFVQSPSRAYQNISITVTPPATSSGEASAPEGTYRVAAGNSTADIIWTTSTPPVRTCSGFIYLVDNVLLPKATLTALSQGGEATTPIAEAGESEGSSVESDGSATEG